MGGDQKGLTIDQASDIENCYGAFSGFIALLA
jgi:hypothetical protein